MWLVCAKLVEPTTEKTIMVWWSCLSPDLLIWVIFCMQVENNSIVALTLRKSRQASLYTNSVFLFSHDSCWFWSEFFYSLLCFDQVMENGRISRSITSTSKTMTVADQHQLDIVSIWMNGSYQGWPSIDHSSKSLSSSFGMMNLNLNMLGVLHNLVVLG